MIFVPRIFGKFPTFSGIQHTTKPWEIPRIFDRSWTSIWPVSEANLASLCRLLYALFHSLFCMPPQPRNGWLLPSSLRQSMPQDHKGKLKFCERNSANSSLQSLARLTSETGQTEDQNRSKILGISQDLVVCCLPLSVGNFPKILGTEINCCGARVTRPVSQHLPVTPDFILV